MIFDGTIYIICDVNVILWEDITSHFSLINVESQVSFWNPIGRPLPFLKARVNPWGKLSLDISHLV
jgi:hypothetical protein